jgi:antitoxin component HigA of HigAB toxin-antitoxin module
MAPPVAKPRRSPSLADLIRHLMDQYGFTRADMVPIMRRLLADKAA